MNKRLSLKLVFISWYYA